MVAGEASGDLYGAGLARELKLLYPPLQIRGMGGDRMREAGVDLLVPSGRLAVVGVSEALGKLRLLHRAYERLRRALWEERPGVLVLIDFPDFNLFLAKTARKAGVPVLYYVSPQVWAWRSGRIRTIRRLVERMLVTLPFEEGIYRQAGVEVTYVGHPLLDCLPNNLSQERVRQELGLEQGLPVVGLLPGSREEEVQRHLPLMLEAARRILQEIPQARFLLAKADSLRSTYVEERLALEELPILSLAGHTYEIMRAADLLLVASGTATLEAALLEVPMVIIYRVSPISWFLGRILVQVPYIGLANLVVGKRVVPELIQFQATPERIATTALELLADPRALEEMRRELRQVRVRLGGKGASRRAALAVLGIMGLEAKEIPPEGEGCGYISAF